MPATVLIGRAERGRVSNDRDDQQRPDRASFFGHQIRLNSNSKEAGAARAMMMFWIG